MGLSLEQQKEMLYLLKWAKHACWDRTTKKFSSIALNIDEFFATIEHDEIARGIEWEYIEKREAPAAPKSNKVAIDIFGD